MASDLARMLAQNARERVANQDAIANQQLWPNPSKLGQAIWDTVSYPFRNPDKTAEFGLSMAPGSGEAMAARDAWNASGRAGDALVAGNWGEAASEYGNLATALAGAIPGLGVIARGTGRGAAWMDRNLPAGVNKLLDAIMPSDPKSTMNIFAGPNAKTADQSALAKAVEMTQSGVSRDDIWRDTGWFQGADGKWRFEIDDSSMSVSIPKNKWSGEYSPYNKAIDHPDLFAAYPPMQKNRITFDHRTGDSAMFTMKPGPNAVDRKQYDMDIGTRGRVRSDGTQSKPMEIREHVGHELQHNAQGREGFASGGTPEDLFINGVSSPELEAMQIGISKLRRGSPEYDAALDAYTKAQWNEAIDQYRRLAGEVEARNVQTRLPMSAADRRATAPWATQDVPDDQQIVRFGVNGPQAAIPAWHGSPHDFDKFDMSKIGSGEGAQAYGHGMYFSENRDVARAYEGALANNGNDPSVMAREALARAGGDRAAALEILRKEQSGLDQVASMMQHSGDPTFGFTADSGRQVIALLENQGQLPLPGKGRLYRTELDVEPEDLLDWDKSISEQSSKVREAIGRLPEGKAIFEQEALVRQLQARFDEMKTQRMTPEWRAEAGPLSQRLLQERRKLQHLEARFEDYKTLTGSPAASQALREAGIPGIKYLDQGSRGAGSGSSNYVIFSDDLVKILSKE